MLRITIVEDDPADLAQLTNCLRQFEEEQGEHFRVQAFSNPSDFLNNYRSDCDLIFMDIELPLFNGVDVARQLRGNRQCSHPGVHHQHGAVRRERL